MNAHIARGGSVISYRHPVGKRSKQKMSLFELLLMSAALLYLFLLP